MYAVASTVCCRATISASCRGPAPSPARPAPGGRRGGWGVPARPRVPHLGEGGAARELEPGLGGALSGSLFFGPAACEKRDLVAAATAAVAHLTGGGGNRFGAIIATGEK